MFVYTLKVKYIFAIDCTILKELKFGLKQKVRLDIYSNYQEEEGNKLWSHD